MREKHFTGLKPEQAVCSTLVTCLLWSDQMAASRAVNGLGQQTSRLAGEPCSPECGEAGYWGLRAR